MARNAQLSRRLAEAKRAVLQQWEERARRELLAAAKYDRLVLLDGMPKMVDELVIEIAGEVPEGDGEAASSHGRQRAMATEFSLEQVFGEHALMRQVMFDVLGSHGPALTYEDRDAIDELLQRRVREAAAEFTAVRNRERDNAHSELRQAKDLLEETVQKRTAALTASEALFRGLIDAVTDYAIFTLDPTGIVTSWNPGAERMKGYTSQEIMGRHFDILYTEEGRKRDEPMQHLRAAAKEGRFRGEGMRVRKNGEHYLADVSISPMHDERGALTGFTKVVQDLTERSVLMQERDLLKSDADRLRDEAEYRKRFVATLTHDLRSPLSAALVGARLIAESPGEVDKVRRWAQRIANGVERADKLIVDLLDASRLDAGERVMLSFDTCDLARIAQNAIDDQSTRHGARFRLEVIGDTAGFWNADALWRVLDNLLTNAVKYGEHGTPITTRLARIDTRVVLTVHNFGTIIPVAEQEKLFRPFHRSLDAEALGQVGWGLGLTLVRGFVDAHKGLVKVESYPSAGTTFTVDLPCDPRS